MIGRRWLAILGGMLWLGSACEDDAADSTRSQDAAPFVLDRELVDTGVAAGEDVAARDALAGACAMMSTTGQGGEPCEGIEDYIECTRELCDLQACVDSDCSETFACLQDASEPCESDCLAEASMACQDCRGTVGTCAAESCVHLLRCGNVTEGGPCDQLLNCCDALPEAEREPCLLGANAARSSGDEVCMMAMDALCM